MLSKFKDKFYDLCDYLEEIEDVDMWVPKDLTLPLGIYRYPSMPATKEFLAHFSKNQP